MPELTTLDLVLPFAVLLLPLAGFVVLALFGDWIKRDKEESGACWLACGTVLAAFGLAALSCLRLYGLARRQGGSALHAAVPGLRVDRGRRLPRPAQPADRPALVRDDAGRERDRLADPRLLDRLHGARRGPRALLRLPEPVHVLHAAAGDGRQPAAAVRRLGGRRALLLPADRVLVQEGQRLGRRAQGVRREPDRRRRA